MTLVGLGGIKFCLYVFINKPNKDVFLGGYFNVFCLLCKFAPNKAKSHSIGMGLQEETDLK